MNSVHPTYTQTDECMEVLASEGLGKREDSFGSHPHPELPLARKHEAFHVPVCSRKDQRIFADCVRWSSEFQAKDQLTSGWLSLLGSFKISSSTPCLLASHQDLVRIQL